VEQEAALHDKNAPWSRRGRCWDKFTLNFLRGISPLTIRDGKATVLVIASVYKPRKQEHRRT